MSGMNTAPYQEFAREKLGFEFTKLDLLITALTHRSYVNEHRKSVHEHNERLEFLGDAVLELAVTEYLFAHFSEPEGILTAWRAANWAMGRSFACPRVRKMAPIGHTCRF